MIVILDRERKMKSSTVRMNYSNIALVNTVRTGGGNVSREML